MARKKLVFVNDAEEEGKQTLDKADGDPSTKEGTPLVSPKKIKLSADREGVGSESVGYRYACSSPSASDFVLMPAVKPSRKKNASSSKIFSDEDEIALLNGLSVFWANGKNNKWTEFYQFIKSDLTNQFSKTQVSEKVRKLRIKFETNFERARANGGRLDFSNSHETSVFGLCKALWGDEKGAVEENEEAQKIEKKGEEVGEEKMQRKRKEVDEEHRQNNVSEKQKQVDDDNEGNNSAEKGKQQVMEISHEDFQSAFPLFYASFDTFRYPDIVKEKCNLIPREKAQEVEEKCRELKAEALRLELKRIDLIKRDLQEHLQKV